MTIATEAVDPRYADLDLWPTERLVVAMLDGQREAAAAVGPAAAALASAAEAAAARLRDAAGRLVYAGAGTSGRLAVQDGVELGPTYGWDAARTVYALAGGERALTSSVEGAEDDAAAGRAAIVDARVGPADVAIGIAASGATPYTLAAVRAAAERGALTIGIACNAGAPLLAACAHPVLLDTGPEFVAGSTRMKAGTAQKIALNLLSTSIMVRLGHVYAGLMVDMRVSNRKLQARAVAMVRTIAGVDEPVAADALARGDRRIKVAVLVAKGLSPAVARERLAACGDDLRRALATLG